MPREPKSPQRRVQLTGRASRFLLLLLDLGHLDLDTANRVVVGVGDIIEGDVADLADVRRAVAMVVFPVDEAGLQGLLADDWPVLFS